MSLCNYFINGSCRFGSKCVNDHIDVKTLIKNEAEAVIQGKQWLLSCLGPFKESICVPNFIQDQSFEELRVGFIESSKNGTVQQYLSSLMNEYNSALSKMNELKTASPEIIQVIASIYKTSTEQKPAASNQTKPSSSVFGTTATSSASTTMANPFGGNIFASNPQTTMSTSSIFGNSTNSNVFGGVISSATDQKSTFSFAQPVKSSVFGNSVFGGTSQQQPSSIFGQTAQVNPFSQPVPTSQTNIFTQQSNTNVFNQPAIQPSPNSAPSIFGAVSSPSVQQPSSSIFGSTNVFPQQISVFSQPQASSNIFASQVPNQAVVPAQNVFAIQQQQPAMGSANSNPFQQQTQSSTTIHPSAYSKPEELSAEEQQAFQAPNFTLGQIPLKPPTKELCH